LNQNLVDLVVVGCGVAGASAAIAAAKHNITVSVFEEHSEVGEPSHCSGHVGISAFKRFGPAIPNRIIENKIKGAFLYAPNGRSLTLHRNEPVTWVINRTQFDKHLASLAKKNGAQLHLNSRVESFRRSDDGGLELRTTGSTHTKTSCRIIIDATGCAATISRYGGIPRRRPSLFVNSAQCDLDRLIDIEENFVEVYFSQKYAPGFFGWIIPRRDGTAKVGLAAGLRANVRQCFESFLKKHPIASQKLKRARYLTRPRYHPIPIDGGANQTFSEGILAVGDSASQVKPTTGGGIVFGLACGTIAGETAARAVEERDTTSRSLSSYEKRWRDLIGFDLNTMSKLRRLLYGLPDRQLNWIFNVSRELHVDQILNRTGDIDFQGRALASLARDPRLFLTLVSASLLSIPSLLRNER